MKLGKTADAQGDFARCREVGAKTDTGSYGRIAAAIGLPPAEILFLSDAPAEIAAARAAGLKAVRLARDGQAVAGDVASFDEISVI